jgi:hypothetical protein
VAEHHAERRPGRRRGYSRITTSSSNEDGAQCRRSHAKSVHAMIFAVAGRPRGGTGRCIVTFHMDGCASKLFKPLRRSHDHDMLAAPSQSTV